MSSRQPRLFPDSIDMERAGVKLKYRKEKEKEANCGCDMCTLILWTPISCLCELPPFKECKLICIG